MSAPVIPAKMSQELAVRAHLRINALDLRRERLMFSPVLGRRGEVGEVVGSCEGSRLRYQIRRVYLGARNKKELVGTCTLLPQDVVFSSRGVVSENSLKHNRPG